MGEREGPGEGSEEITLVERQFVVRTHLRKKHRCKHGGAPVTAPGPLKLVEGGRYSAEFAVYVARQGPVPPAAGTPGAHVRRQRSGQTLWDPIEPLAKHLDVSYQALLGETLASPLIHAETA